MRTGVFALLLVAACGQVDKTVQDAPALDAFQPDSPAACGMGEMLCGGTCENVTSNMDHCGSCTNVCDPSQLCSGSTCIAQWCARVREMNPAATDGFYPNPNPGATGDLYCDFTDGFTYVDFAVMSYTAPPPGYSVVRGSDLANAAFAKVFIAYFNRTGGIHVYAPFSTSNCCMGPFSGVRYAFSGQPAFVGKGTVTACNQAYATTDILTFGLNGSNYQAMLPANYFTANPPTEAGLCGDGNNAAWYYNRRIGLN